MTENKKNILEKYKHAADVAREKTLDEFIKMLHPRVLLPNQLQRDILKFGGERFWKRARKEETND